MKKMFKELTEFIKYKNKNVDFANEWSEIQNIL